MRFLWILFPVLLYTGCAYRKWRIPIEKRVEGLYWNSSTICDKKEFCFKGINEKILRQAALRSKIICSTVFKYEPWNCSYNKETFHKVSRETGVLYAALSSSLANEVNRECAQGRERPKICTDCNNFKWTKHDCTKNLLTGIEFSKKFLMLNHSPTNLHHKALIHNALLGLKIMKISVTKKCKCHGFSGSCTSQACWESPPSLTEVINNLRLKYHLALQWEYPNRLAKKLNNYEKTRLAYVDPTDINVCSLAPGRECRDPDNCKELCCSNGYIITSQIAHKYCRCTVREQYKVSCESCFLLIDKFFCN